MDGHAQQQAERIDENVALATLDLLARIEAPKPNSGLNQRLGMKVRRSGYAMGTTTVGAARGSGVRPMGEHCPFQATLFRSRFTERSRD